jgi:hypothetical protein
MNTNIVFTPKGSSTVIIEETENNTYEFVINEEVTIIIASDIVKIYDATASSIYVNHKDFKKMIDAYNEIIKRINNEKT